MFNPYKNKSDKELWAILCKPHTWLYITKKKWAFDALYDGHYAKILAYLMYKLIHKKEEVEAIEDAVSEAFKKIWELSAQEKLNPHIENVWVFIVTIARNEFIRDANKRKIFSTDDIAASYTIKDDDEVCTTESGYLLETLRQVVYQGVRKEKDGKQYLEVLLLRMEGYKRDEIAAELGIKLSRVRFILAYMKANIFTEDILAILGIKRKKDEDEEDRPQQSRGNLWFLLFLCLPISLFTQKIDKNLQTPTGGIKGFVYDEITGEGIPNATVLLIVDSVDINIPIANTNEDGSYRLENVPLGRQQITCKSLGYERYKSDGISVRKNTLTSSPDIYLKRKGQKSINEESKDTFITRTRSDNPYNLEATSFTAEQVQRFPAIFNDPARFAMYYAGGIRPMVEYNNGLVVRGNSPQGVLWQIEGLDVVNPNHLPSRSASGGELSLLSLATLGKSDFIKSGFAPEYGNLTSGVMDMKLRPGNNTDIEVTAGISLLNRQLSIEGPIAPKKGEEGKASFILSYRKWDGLMLHALPFKNLWAGMDKKSEDFTGSFYYKPNERHIVKAFYIAGRSGDSVSPNPNIVDRKAFRDFRARRNNDFNVIWGASYKYHPKAGKNYLSVAFAYSSSYLSTNTDVVGLSIGDSLQNAFDNNRIAINRELYDNRKFATHFQYHRIINNRFSLKFGLSPTVFFYSAQEKRYNWNKKELITEIKADSVSHVMYRGYVEALLPLNEKLKLVAGFHSSYYTFNSTAPSFEPRMSVVYDPSQMASIYASYTFSSQVPQMGHYFYTPDNGQSYPNLTSLRPMKSSSISFGTTIQNGNYIFKASAFQQYLYRIPVGDSSNYAITNNGEGLSHEAMRSEGEAENYGLDLSIEHYFTKKWFGIANFSVLSAKFKPHFRNGAIYNSAYSNKISGNLLLGKEWTKIGKKGNLQTIELSGHLVIKDGDYYTPFDIAASKKAKEGIPNYDSTFSKKMPIYHQVDLHFAYSWGKKPFLYLFNFDLQNFIAIEYLWRKYSTVRLQPLALYSWDRVQNKASYSASGNVVAIIGFTVTWNPKGFKKNEFKKK